MKFFQFYSSKSTRRSLLSKPSLCGAWCFIVAASLVAAACGQRDPRFKVLPRNLGFLTNGLVNNKVDILWVIDNSGTMGPKQDNLRTSISSFMDQFEDKGMDYRIAVVTTDIRPVDPLNPNDPNLSGQAACFVSSGANPKIVTPDTANGVQVVGENADVGFFGSADAHGLDAVQLAFSEPNISNCNSGFLRSDAFLAIIEFSDADDNTAATVSALMSFLDTVKSPISTPNNGSVRGYFVSSMVVEDITRAECVALGPFSEVGTKFLDIAAQTGGAVASICDADFSAGLLNVGEKILEATTAVILKDVPDVSTIVVTQNGNRVSNSATNGWTYEVDGNRVVFHGSAIPTSTTYVSIDYTPRDIVR
ncbi:MAG: hypothetical protein AB1540_06470 [Bdellovibrionota bacterium]